MLLKVMVSDRFGSISFVVAIHVITTRWHHLPLVVCVHDRP